MKQTSLSVPPVARPSRTAAFTLIELLSVIAIVGILAAILIPTVGSVRASAQQAACLSNLRQISLATLAYAGEHKGMLPGSFKDGAWQAMIRAIRNPEINTVTFTNRSTAAESTQFSTQLALYLDTTKSGNLWRCPSNQAGIDASTGISSANETTYLLNQKTTTNPQLLFGGVKIAPTRLNQIIAASSTASDGLTASGRQWSTVSDLSQIWMISDLDSTNYGGQSGYPAKTATDAVPMPHRGGRNYAFFDGHAEYRKADNLPANP